MRSNRKSKTFVAVLAVLAGLATVSAFAFVPSCEDELAQAYPPALRADLSACDAEVRAVWVAAEPGIQIEEFGAALTGSWLLRSRTAHGITVNDESREGHLYFDLQAREGDRLAGSALLVDRPKGDGPMPTSSSAAAFWGLRVVAADDHRLVLSMSGDSLGSYAHVHLAADAGFDFVQHKGVYVSTPDDSEAASPAWDRVVVMEGSLTFVSCELGLVERYVKTSSQSPTVEGASLEKYWQQIRTEGQMVSAHWPSWDIAGR